MPAPSLARDRIARIQTLMRDLSREHDPDATLQRFSAAMEELYGQPAAIFVRVVDDVPGGYVVKRLVDERGVVAVDKPHPWVVRPGEIVHQGGFVGGFLEEERAVLLTHIDVPTDPVFGDRLRANHAAVALPLYEEGEIRTWVVLLHPDPDHFDERELETMLLRVNVMGGMLASQRLNREHSRALAWIRDELDQIAKVQQSLLPRAMPAIDGLDVAARWETFDQAGGDYYDFLPWKADGACPERWTLVLADASGHGPASAVIVAMLHVLLRALPSPTAGPAALLADINARLFDCPSCSNFMTAFVACYVPETRELTYAVAGHHPPLVRRAGGAVEALPVDPAVPLGVLDAVDAPTGKVVLQPGEVLVLYTDGLTEALNAEGERFGDARLVEVLEAAAGSAKDTVDAVFGAVRAFEGGRRPGDDQTLVVVRVE